MVIAMQNPATKMYQVTDLDPALVDRFHARITLTGCPSIDYYKTKGIDESVAKSLVDWWSDDLNDETRQLVTPRTLEYIGGLVRDNLNWKYCLGDSLGVPLFHLETRFTKNCGINKYEGVTLRKVLTDLEAHAELAKNDREFATHIVREIGSSKILTCWDCADVIVSLPEDFQMALMRDSKWVSKMNKEYANLDSSFYDCEEVIELNRRLKQVAGEADLNATEE
jgi:hypothetical protein